MCTGYGYVNISVRGYTPPAMGVLMSAHTWVYQDTVQRRRAGMPVYCNHYVCRDCQKHVYRQLTTYCQIARVYQQSGEYRKVWQERRIAELEAELETERASVRRLQARIDAEWQAGLDRIANLERGMK